MQELQSTLSSVVGLVEGEQAGARAGAAALEARLLRLQDCTAAMEDLLAAAEGVEDRMVEFQEVYLLSCYHTAM